VLRRDCEFALGVEFVLPPRVNRRNILMSETWKPDVCVYHGNCDDGFGAAWAIWKRWGNDVCFIPGSYSSPFTYDVAGKNVLFVDFSLKRIEMQALFSVDAAPASIVILDHHKSAEAELKDYATDCTNTLLDDLPAILGGTKGALPIVAAFDMEKSGARLAWEFCHQDDVPELLCYIEDRDLWRFLFGETTKLVSAGLRSYAQDFDLWTQLSESVGRLEHEGVSILRAHRKNVSQFCAQHYVAPLCGHTVLVVNVPYYCASDCADELMSMYPDFPFAVAWFRRGDGLYQYSLRSRDDRTDVSEVARLFGGGGHRNAAGFTVNAYVL
jgi:hypothetical protein